MCGRHLQYEERMPSNAKPKVPFKPESQKREYDPASQIIGDKPILDAMQRDFEKKSK